MEDVSPRRPQLDTDLAGLKYTAHIIRSNGGVKTMTKRLHMLGKVGKYLDTRIVYAHTKEHLGANAICS